MNVSEIVSRDSPLSTTWNDSALLSTTSTLASGLSSVSMLLNNTLDNVVSIANEVITNNISAKYANIGVAATNDTYLNLTENNYYFHCKDGLILPCWYSDGSLNTILFHGFIYLIAMIYAFVGVAIIADRFMSSIEQITSQERDVIVRRPNGDKEIVSVRIWNETVSNLTLMALGSSAPEIMLSVIEIYAQDFQAGELGPGTVVGSAAFNMFIIIAICVWAIPSDQLKKIKYLRVFIITMSFSVFAYVWMLMILVWFSPGIIEVWEGLVTLFFFYLTVQIAYIADKRLLIYKYIDKHYRLKSKSKVYYSNNGKSANEDGTDAEKMELNTKKVDDAQEQKENGTVDEKLLVETINKNVKYIDVSEDDLRFIEDHRENIIEILKDVKSRYPNSSAQDIETIARIEIARLQPKSRAFYRMIASRKILGSSNDAPSEQYSSHESIVPVSEIIEKVDTETDLELNVIISFDPKEYTVMEDVGSLVVTVRRTGDLESTIAVNYSTEDGSAKSGTDYVAKSGTVIFGPSEAHKQITISIINDDEFEEDEHFFVKLSDAHYVSAAMDVDNRLNIVISENQAKINILDDDHSGVFSFVNNVFQIPETIGEYQLAVHRYCGARGQVVVPYRTIPATAKPNVDFLMVDGELVFNNNETQRYINLQIINNVNYEKNSIFYVQLYDPIRKDLLPKDEKYDERGAPRLGDLTKCMIRIRESKDFKQIVDNLMRRKKAPSHLDRAGSWENQIISAVRVHKLSTSIGSNFSDRIEDLESPKKSDVSKEETDSSEPKSIMDYIMHYLTLFWKIAFIFVPPPTIWNGWACFIVSISVIGMLTALINDLASHFGSTVYLKDQVTAISLVALGTSVPDTFASKIAAQNEKHADSSIGNVTGSNAVNVFLGIGLAWTVAAVYHAINGTPGGFRVEPGSLCYSVLLFCICAFICAIILMLRRFYIGAELGGPIKPKIATVACFVFLWIFYLVMSTLEAYKVIEGF